MKFLLGSGCVGEYAVLLEEVDELLVVNGLALVLNSLEAGLHSSEVILASVELEHAPQFLLLPHLRDLSLKLGYARRSFAPALLRL